MKALDRNKTWNLPVDPDQPDGPALISMFCSCKTCEEFEDKVDAADAAFNSGNRRDALKLYGEALMITAVDWKGFDGEFSKDAFLDRISIGELTSMVVRFLPAATLADLQDSEATHAKMKEKGLIDG